MRQLKVCKLHLVKHFLNCLLSSKVNYSIYSYSVNVFVPLLMLNNLTLFFQQWLISFIKFCLLNTFSTTRFFKLKSNTVMLYFIN